MIQSSNEAPRVDDTVDLYQESESIDPSLQDRVKMGIKYRVEDKMTWAAAANKAKVGIQRIRTAIKNKNPDTKSLMGRPPIMSNEQVLRLHDNVTRASLQLKSVLSCRFVSMMRETPTEDEEPLKTSISTRSVYNYKRRLDFRERQAQQEASRRIDGFEEIRNPLSLIGPMGAVYDHVSPSLVLSTDNVPILANGMESKPPSSSAVIGAPIVVKQVKCASGSLFSCKSAVSSDKIAATAGWKCCRRCCKRWTCPKEKCQELLNVHEEAESCRVAKKPKV